MSLCFVLGNQHLSHINFIIYLKLFIFYITSEKIKYYEVLRGNFDFVLIYDTW